MTEGTSSTPGSLHVHKPYVPPEANIPELGLAPIVVGAILGIIFGASSLYLVLKVGMTVSASIPIAVLSITLFRLFKPMFGRNATILENNMVQTTGSAGESIAFGVGVTMPALLILGYNLELTRVMLVAVLGGLLGVLMMIPLRRVFVVKQHGKLVYPEGVACAEVLIVGEKGGSSAATVFSGFAVSFIYQLLMDGLKLWKAIPETLVKIGKFEFKGATLALEANPALLGVGYVIGPRIASIMVAGGVLASWVLVPAIVLFGQGAAETLYPGEKPIRDMTIEEVWKTYVLYIGAGAVAAGGIISMIQSLPMIASSVGAGLRDVMRRGEAVRAAVSDRLDRDIPMPIVLAGCVVLVLAITFAPMLNMNIWGGLMIVFFGFLFVTVSARLTGEIGSSSNPISGMTVATLLMTCLIFVLVGWTGPEYRLMALSIAGIVCIACSNGGTVAQCLKTGYIVGATPRAQEIGILVGALTSALVIGVTLLLLNNASTIYSRQHVPDVRVDLSSLTDKEFVKGKYAAEDPNEYRVLFADVGEIQGVPHGKYLVDESGAIKYLVDPGINGRLKQTDDGQDVTKYTAPKAALMSFIVDGILTQKLPWTLVLLGVAISLVLELSGIPSLPFAVGVYLPLSTSTPIFVGGMLRWIGDKVSRRTPAEAEMSSGVLLSSGYIAGGSIAGIIVALVTLAGGMAVSANRLPTWLLTNAAAVAIFGVLALLLLVVGSRRSRHLS